jgi:hypothetical protein
MHADAEGAPVDLRAHPSICEARSLTSPIGEGSSLDDFPTDISKASIAR